MNTPVAEMRKYGHLEEMKTQKRMHVWVKSIPDDVLMHVLLKMLSVIGHRKGRQILSGTSGSENGIQIAAVSGPCAQRVDRKHKTPQTLIGLCAPLPWPPLR